MYQDSGKIYLVEAKLSVQRLKERIFVRDMECNYCQAKYNATDNLIRWLRENSERLNIRCDLTQPGLPEFVRFCDTTKGEGGLVCERHAKFGSLVSDW